MKTTKTIDANIKVHESLLLAGEYAKSPHRRDEGRRHLTEGLMSAGRAVIQANPRHLDVGCGDGFVFECAPKFWKSFGVDAAPKMLEQCEKNHPNVVLARGTAEALPFDNSSFDILTCYSFLDHLEKRELFYREAVRVLKPGGVFYFGLSPNRIFAKAVAVAAYTSPSNIFDADVVLNELTKAKDNGAYYKSAFGISEADLEDAEPGKSEQGGMDPIAEVQSLESLGFKSLRVAFHWIMNQNKLDANTTRSIYSALPITASAFKYFDLYGLKE